MLAIKSTPPTNTLFSFCPLSVVPSLPAADGSGRTGRLRRAGRLRQDVAPSLLRVLHLQRAAGGHDLLLEERQHVLRPPLRRQREATLRRLWWGEGVIWAFCFFKLQSKCCSDSRLRLCWCLLSWCLCVHSWSSVTSTPRPRARTGIWSTSAVLTVTSSLLGRRMSWRMKSPSASPATWRTTPWWETPSVFLLGLIPLSYESQKHRNLGTENFKYFHCSHILPLFRFKSFQTRMINYPENPLDLF